MASVSIDQNLKKVVIPSLSLQQKVMEGEGVDRWEWEGKWQRVG